MNIFIPLWVLYALGIHIGGFCLFNIILSSLAGRVGIEEGFILGNLWPITIPVLIFGIIIGGIEKFQGWING